jgi:hypothetical protein
MNGDWLDGLARRTTRSAAPEAVADQDEGARLSRAAALKVGAASVAALSSGLTLVPSAGAADRGECIGSCYEKYINAAERALRSCDDLYGDDRFYNAHPDWQQFHQLVKDGPWSFVRGAVREVMRRTCVTNAENAFKRGLDRCDSACRETCTSDTRAHSSALGQSTCRGTDPPRRAEQPPPPPPPDDANDPCAACEAVGGLCCGPAPPGGAPCGCAGYVPPDGTPCGRVGC